MDYRRQLSANSRPYYANNRQMSRQFSRQLSKNFNREKTEYFPTANLKVNVNLKLHERLVYQLIDRRYGFIYMSLDTVETFFFRCFFLTQQW